MGFILSEDGRLKSEHGDDFYVGDDEEYRDWLLMVLTGAHLTALESGSQTFIEG